jgi:ATP-dependent RNA helicase DeaD
LNDAGVHALWNGPPSAEDIRKLDQERLLLDPILTEPPGEEDFEMARLLLAERTPEQLGAALVRVYRSRLPALEEVTDPGNGPDRDRRARGAPGQPGAEGPKKSGKAARADFTGAAAWFHLNIGRSKNADPKWLLPMLCRKGGITKQDIGAIRIFENETKIEIAEPVAAQFAINMKKPGGDNFRIERLQGEGSSGPAQSAQGDVPGKAAKPRGEKTHGEKTHGEKPNGGKPNREKPHDSKPNGGKMFAGKSNAGQPNAGQKYQKKPKRGEG